MKKITRFFLFISLVFLGLFGLTACGKGDSESQIPEETITPEPIISEEHTDEISSEESLIEITGIKFNDQEFTYNGENHYLKIEGKLPEGVNVSYSNNGKINAGVYEVIASFEDTTNKYIVPNDMSALLTINKASLPGLTFSDKTYTYDGLPHSIKIDGELPEGINVTYTNNEQINAGTYEVTANFEDTTNNYKIPSTMSAYLIIKKANINNVSFIDKSFTYDGLPHSLKISGELPEGVSMSYVNNNQVNAGTYDVIAKFEGNNDNYNLYETLTAKLTINKANIDGISFKNNSFMYDGNAHSIYIDGNLPNGVNVNYKNNNQINAGTYDVVAQFTDTTNNYIAPNDLKAKLIISKNDTVKINFEDKSFTYDGNYHSIKINSNLPSGINVTYTNNNQINAGVYNVVANLKDTTGNYEIPSTLTANLTINKAAVNGINFKDCKVKYDCEPHSIYIDGYVPNGVKVTYNHNSFTEIGTYIIIAHFEDTTGNYVVPSDMAATLTIEENIHLVTFKQKFSKDIIIEVNHNKGIATLPEIDKVDGYNASWEEFDSSKIITDLTINAIYTPITYKIDYQLKHGTNSPKNPLAYTIESETILLENATREGYEFFGWYLDPNYNKEIKGIVKGTYGDLTIYARWLNYEIESAPGFEITNEDQEVPTLSLTVPSSTDKIDLNNRFTISEDCTWKLFKDFEGNEELILKAMKLETGHNYAFAIVFHQDNKYFKRYKLDIYRLASITYTFTDKNGEVLSSGVLEENETIDAIKEKDYLGYNFISWTLNGKNVTFPMIASKDNLAYAFIPSYKAINYNIKYELGGGINSNSNPNSYTIESNTINFSNPTRVGYHFIGWYQEKEFINKITSIPQGSHKDVTLYAKWDSVEYHIYYELNGGVNNLSNIEDFTIESNDIILKDPQKTGYSFIGWYSDSSFNNKITTIYKGSTKDYYLYAKWNLNTYTITYNLDNGNNNPSNPNTFTYLSNDILLLDPTKNGHSFDGWYLDANFEKQIQTIKAKSHDNITLYAKWIKVTTGVICEIRNDYAVITSYKGTDKDVFLPHMYQGKPIKIIDKEAFINNTNITSIVVPNTVEKIEFSAFLGCSNLLRVTLPYGIKELSGFAFSQCSSLTEINLPDTISIIGTDCFNRCSSLVNIQLPSSLTTVEENLFKQCSSLVSITIPDKVTSIGIKAFYFCKNLKNVTLSKSVTSIGDSCFWGDNNLTNVYYKGSSYQFNNIKMGADNIKLTSANIIYNYQG